MDILGNAAIGTDHRLHFSLDWNTQYGRSFSATDSGSPRVHRLPEVLAKHQSFRSVSVPFLLQLHIISLVMIWLPKIFSHSLQSRYHLDPNPDLGHCGCRVCCTGTSGCEVRELTCDEKMSSVHTHIHSLVQHYVFWLVLGDFG